MVQKGSGTAPTESQSGDGNNAVTDYKKYTAHGLVRRGCPKGPPAREIQPQPIQVSWQVFTSHEPRATIFSTSRGLLEAMSSIWVCRCVVASESEENGVLRSVTDSPDYEILTSTRRSSHVDAPTMAPLLFAKYFSCYSWGNCVQ